MNGSVSGIGAGTFDVTMYRHSGYDPTYTGDLCLL